MKKFLFYSLFLVPCSLLTAQNAQTVRGQVVDNESKATLPGVVVTLQQDSTVIKGCATDVDGNYRFEDVAVGRYSLCFKFVGYKALTIPGIIVTSGKEYIQNVEIEQSVITKDEVVITATSKQGTVNDFGTGSGRQFSVDETQRYAG